MPFKSKSQQRFMHAAASRGDIDPKTVHEFDEATKHKKGGFGKLPEKVHHKKAFVEGFAGELLDKAAKPLTAMGRNHIKKKNFALGGGRYPIHDEAHARNALSRVAQHGSSADQAAVRAKVHAKYPGIGK